MNKFISAGLAVLLALLMPVGAVFADDISNTIDASIDAAIENIQLSLPGANGSVTFIVQPRNTDGKNGCNLTASNDFQVAVNVSDSNIVEVTPSVITFTSCGDTPVVTVTPKAAGSAVVSLSQIFNETAGTFNLAPATFGVEVTSALPVDETAPVIVPTVSPDANAAGWHNSDVTVSWSVTDNESAISSSAGCETTVLTEDTAGTTVTCSATSAGGTSSESVTIKLDKTAPVIVLNSPSARNYTFKQDILADWNVSDALSGIEISSGTVASGEKINVATLGAKSFSVTATDVAGNTSTEVVNYNVVGYNFIGFAAPITLSKNFKKGSTLPVKFTLTDVFGNKVSNGIANLWLNGDGKKGASKGGANTGNLFRYDSAAGQYIFNLGTDTLKLGINTVYEVLDDGSTQSVQVVVK